MPAIADGNLAQHFEFLGRSKSINTAKGFIWLVESDIGINLIIKSGRNEIDARFKHRMFPANRNSFEIHLVKYFPTCSIKET